MIKEVAAHESRSHCTLMKNIEANNKSKNKDRKLKTILSIRSFKRTRFPDGRLMNNKSRLCAHGGMKQWGVNYWNIYVTGVNRISFRSLLAIASIHELTSR